MTAEDMAARAVVDLIRHRENGFLAWKKSY
jgi:hypothetical protein